MAGSDAVPTDPDPETVWARYGRLKDALGRYLTEGERGNETAADEALGDLCALAVTAPLSNPAPDSPAS